MGFPKEIKRIRQRSFLTQQEFANVIGVAFSTVNRWESGRANPNQKNLEELAKILDDDVTNFESEYNIVNNFLQLTTAN